MSIVNPRDAVPKSSAASQVVPFLKWAGGKRWFTLRYLDMVPESYLTYIEPFLGSGAMFFALQPERAVLSDINSDLINCFQAICKEPEAISKKLIAHHSAHCTEHYYHTRTQKPADPVRRAAWLIYLNRTCWNGLYRVNKRNEFNVPIGSKKSVVLPTDDFTRIGRLLLGAEILCQDFEETIDAACPGDFVFVDPPYTVNHNLNGFLKYNDKVFSWADQLRLRDAVERASVRGAQVLVTNANHKSVREIYSRIGRLDVIERTSVLAADAAHRIQTEEPGCTNMVELIGRNKIGPKGFTCRSSDLLHRFRF